MEETTIWNAVVLLLLGALLSSIGFIINEYFGLMRWRKQKKLDLWKERKKEYRNMLTPDLIEAIVNKAVHPEALHSLTLMRSDIREIWADYQHGTGTSRDMAEAIMEMSRLIEIEIEKCDSEIESITNSWF